MKISSVDLSKITTYRFGGVCKSFIELVEKKDLNNLDEILLGKENVIIGLSLIHISEPTRQP